MDVFVECPHCGGGVLIARAEINCAIFRHGVIRCTGQQLDPHAPKLQCDALAAAQALYGCGKPFQLVLEAAEGRTSFAAKACDYI